jgi:Asp-tRNA(Asn)/Glu-tRNA(Gln) amidotransferase A subunit family amidase
VDGLVRPRSLVADVARLRGAGTAKLGRYVQELCRRIDTVQPLLQAFVPEPDRAARLLASAGAGGFAAAPLAGALVAVKDILNVDGLPTRAGSRLPPELFAGPQAAVVDRLLAAGALVAGKTVTAEFAVAAPGPTTNPHDVRHTPGGSSSGSAAAVAAGLAPLALGTQTVGSVIRPAAYCGVVGFRPTWGTLPADGVVPNAPSLDTVGLFTADVASAALAARVLCGWPEQAAVERQPVLGVPDEAYLSRASPLARDAFAGQVQRLRAAGFAVRRAALADDLEALTHHLLVINHYELAQVHRVWFAGYAADYRPQTADAIRRGQTLSASDHAASQRWRRGFVERLTSVTVEQGIDVWISPAATGPAPRGLGSTGDPAMSAPFSLAGMPALSLPIPAPTGSTLLPLGLQCAALPGADRPLLAAAAQIQRALGPEAGDPSAAATPAR